MTLTPDDQHDLDRWKRLAATLQLQLNEWEDLVTDLGGPWGFNYSHRKGRAWVANTVKAARHVLSKKQSPMKHAPAVSVVSTDNDIYVPDVDMANPSQVQSPTHGRYGRHEKDCDSARNGMDAFQLNALCTDCQGEKHD